MCTVSGSFFRAVDPAYRYAALEGSRSAGRYSPLDTPTLYLSSSRDGVAAAMIAHSDTRAARLEVLQFDVEAERIVDLRDHETLKSIGVDPADAAADWQELAAAGCSPPSWKVREILESVGANGLIDPSRKQPHLWHLTLFSWNIDGAPSVREVPVQPIG
ncbi:RES domain-containing protein [Arthrobacter sp. Sa2CUA1]|uniref:RES domain-containing protein n=2 Tax=Arthrobacter gallicola TaxID=2762225 RepID=A0ABR8UMY6_9MICC|nr:RES domain-containing protein [Arthrobacter gallicola]